MSSKRIADLPVKNPTEAMKIPTGGFGDYAVTLKSISEWLVGKYSLATKEELELVDDTLKSLIELKADKTSVYTKQEVDTIVQQAKERLEQSIQLTDSRVGSLETTVDSNYQTLSQNKADKNNVVNSVGGRKGDITYQQIKDGLSLKDSDLQTWSGQSQEQKNKDSIHVLDFKSGSKTDQQAIQDAVNYCLSNNRSLNWDGANLTSTSNILNFWGVQHKGQGSVSIGTDIFSVNSNDNTKINTLYVATTGTVNNDGLSPSRPTTISRAFHNIGNLDSQSLDVQWRIKLAAGTYNEDGLRITQFPKTTQAVVLEGADLVSGRTTSNWSGLSSTNAFALRLDSCDSYKNLKVIKLGFSDWSADAGNAGALVGNQFESLEFDQCEFLRMPIGVWATRSKGKITRSLFEDCGTWGICAQHNSRFNVGNTTSGMGNTFRRCGSAIAAGRLSVIYIENNDFYEITRACEANKMSRIRCGYNRYHTWKSDAIGITGIYYLAENALLNKAGTETYNITPTLDNPIYYTQQSGYNTDITYQSTPVLATNTYLEMTSFSEAVREIVSGANALRVPYTLFYTKNFTLEVEFMLLMSAGKGGKIDITGAGTSAASIIASATLPPNTGAGNGVKVKFKIYRGDNGIARYDVECPKLNYYSYLNPAVGINSLNPQTVAPTDTQLVLRTYVTPDTNSGSIEFYHMTSVLSI